MRGIEEIYSINSLNDLPCKKPNDVSKSNPVIVKNYGELISLITKVSYKNNNLFPLFRGQKEDFRTKPNDFQSKLIATIDRPPEGENSLSTKLREKRIQALIEAKKEFLSLLKEKQIPKNDFKMFDELTWAVFQHYDIMPTPLLDLTQSILVACSIAFSESKTGVIYMLGFDELTPTMSFSHRNRSLIIRLASVMPEIALRPLHQEGYLISNFPESIGTERKENFSNRLLAKFEIKDNKEFWSGSFNKIDKDILFPPKDEMKKLLEPLKIKYQCLKNG